MADLVAHIANLVVIGEKPSTHLIAAGKTWVRNHIPLKLSRRQVDLFQLPVVFGDRKKLRGRWVHTTTAYVRNVSDNQRPAAERLVTDLCHLLSFATMSEVRPFAFSLSGKSHRWSGTGIVSDWRSPIESDGEAVASFVKQAWPSYRRLKRSRSLPELIHYLSVADLPDQPLEVRMLLAFVALEHMKNTWAHSKGIPFVDGFFQKPVGPGVKKGARYGIRELLELMFAEKSLRPRLKRIVGVRNQIIHMGVTTRPFRSNLSYYERTKALEHEYVLRLLGYRGMFYDYQTQAARVL